MATEKINFNVSPNIKRDIELLASSHNKTLSAFMIEVCNILIESNKDRIQKQFELANQPINFGGNVTTKKPAAQIVSKADDNIEN